MGMFLCFLILCFCIFSFFHSTRTCNRLSTCVSTVAGPMVLPLSSNKFSTRDSKYPLVEFAGCSFSDTIISAQLWTSYERFPGVLTLLVFTFFLTEYTMFFKYPWSSQGISRWSSCKLFRRLNRGSFFGDWVQELLHGEYATAFPMVLNWGDLSLTQAFGKVQNWGMLPDLCCLQLLK